MIYNSVLQNLGVMQGRLLPKYKKLYQSHPYFNWKKEFKIAKQLKLKHIEFIFDNNLPHHNPLMSEKSNNEILKLIKQYKVRVENLCADYFMEKPFYLSGQESFENIETIKILIENGSKLGVKNIIIPCVDSSSLNSSLKKKNLIKNLTLIGKFLEKKKISISLEADLSPIDFKKLLTDANLPYLKVNYDVGNSACLGYDINEEFDSYGYFISTIHIKDRLLNGKSVYLGKGNTNFNKLFNKINELNFKGAYTMQVYRDNDGLNILKRQLITLKKILKNYEKFKYK